MKIVKSSAPVKMSKSDEDFVIATIPIGKTMKMMQEINNKT
jgi:hypothetical protein